MNLDAWQSPACFLLLVPVALLLWRRARGRPRLPLLAPADAAPLPRSLRSRLVALPLVLEGLGLAFAVTALAAPVRQVPAPPERLVRDVVLCLDRSSSMAQEDLAPGRTRLSVAREMAARLLALRPDDRFGCVAFARYADLRCPPTLDHAALGELLADVALVAAEGPEDATGIGGAVAAAADVLSRSSVTGRVVVLLTDGEENVATRTAPDEIAPVHAAQFCAQLGVRVHAIALGRDAGRDTTAVERLTAATGGRFFRAADADTLLGLAAAIDRLEPVRFAPPGRVVEQGFAPWLVAAVVLLFAAHALGRTWLAEVP